VALTAQDCSDQRAGALKVLALRPILVAAIRINRLPADFVIPASRFYDPAS
jgi:hypothetical protein